jgi:hypothetical protein
MSDNFRVSHNGAVKATRAPLAIVVAGVLPD